MSKQSYLLDTNKDANENSKELHKNILSLCLLVLNPNSRLGVTERAKELTRDKFGDLASLVNQDSTRDPEVAKRRINNFIRQKTNEIESIAEETANKVLNLLDQQADTYRNHNKELCKIIEEIHGLSEKNQEAKQKIDTQIKAIAQRLTETEPTVTQLQTQPLEEPSTSMFQKMKKVVHSVKQKTQNLVQNTVASPIFSKLQKELVSAELKREILLLEEIFLATLISFLEPQINANEDSLVKMEKANKDFETRATIAETTRDWGLSGGELILNSRQLTSCLINQFFNGSDNLINSIETAYKEKYQDSFLAKTKGEVQEADLIELVSVIEQVVTNALQDTTAVDILALLFEDKGLLDIKSQLQEQLRATLDFNCLTPGIANILRLNKFFALTNPKSLQQATNDKFQNELADVWTNLHMPEKAINYKVDMIDKETLEFRIELFALPVCAFEFFSKTSKQSVEEVLSNPKYMPFRGLADKYLHS